MENIIKKISFQNKYQIYSYLFNLNEDELKTIGIKNLALIIKKQKIKKIGIEINSNYINNDLIKIKNYLNFYLNIERIENLWEISYENLNLFLKISYSKYDLIWLEKNISKIRKDFYIFLSLEKFNSQEDVQKSYFLEIFNLFKNNGFRINSDFIRYESAYKNIYIIGPREIKFDLNEHCNANCVFCYTNGPGFLNSRESFENKHKQKTNLTHIENLINGLKYIGTEILTIGMTGEPFLIKNDVNIFLDEIKKTNLKIGFLTNGYKLLENIDGIIGNKNIESFYINISSGDYESFKKTRIGDNFSNFLNTWKAIKIIKEKRPEIKIKTLYIVTPENIKGIKNFITLSENNSVDEIEIKEVINHGFNDELNFSQEKYLYLVEYLKKTNKNIKIKNNINNIIEKFEIKGKKEKINISLINKCYNHYLYGAVVRNNLFSCCQFLLKIGKVSKGELEKTIKGIDENNKIFEITKDTKSIIFKERFEKECLNCFHLENLKEINNYIKLKKIYRNLGKIKYL